MGNKSTRAVHKIQNAISEERRKKTARLQHLFNQFDSRNKGCLSKADMVKMGCKALRQRSNFWAGRNKRIKLLNWMSSFTSCVIVRTEAAQNAFDEVDADGDGRVSREEFVNYFLEHDELYEYITLALD
jgi:Ca2+-binding EF-hand superfamily protein